MRSTVVSVVVRQARACVADVVLLAEEALLVVVPSGGQGRSRRNAWRAMSGEAVLAAARRESEAALRLAIARSAAAGEPIVRAAALAE